MPPIAIILASMAVAASIPILWVSLAGSRTAKTSVLGEVTDARTIVLERAAGERVGRPALLALGARLSRLTPQSRIESLRHKLTLAGSTGRYGVERLLIAKFGAATLTVLGLMVMPLGQIERFRLLVVIGGGLIGYYLPDYVVTSRGRKRQEQIQLELPDTLDQVRMTVDAGLGFEAALARAAAAGDGPLAHELHRLLREMQLGVSRTEALRNLSARTDVADIDSFVVAVVQSQAYGIPIASVLRVQSDELRDKRKQRAEERALKIPVLLIFPLAFCIFPAMFIVLLGPAVIRIFRDLGPSLTP
jgi:tight adherence protein C